MAEITIQSETRHDRQWTFKARIEDGGRKYDYTITLNWAEYNLWCEAGSVPPERVVKAALEFLLEREPASSILSKFDCSVIRRYFPEVDEELPKRIR